MALFTTKNRIANMRLKSSFLKTFAIYLIFLLMMLAMVFPFFSASVSTLEARTLETSREALASGLNRLEVELNHAYQMCQILSYSESFRHYLRTAFSNNEALAVRDVVDILAIQEKYINLYNMLSLMDDVGILMPNGTLLLNRRVHVPSETVWGLFLSVEGFDSLNEWIESMSPLDGINYYSVRAVHLRRYDDAAYAPYLTFHFDVGVARSQVSHCFCLIRQDSLIDSLALGEVLDHARLTIRWGDRTLIDRMPDDMSDDIISLSTMSQKYQLETTLDIERSYFTLGLRPYYQIFMALLAILLCGGICMALFFSHRSISPLKEMVQAIDGAMNAPKLPHDTNAYEYIHQFIRLADERLEENKLALANQELFLRENLMERILRGQIFRDDVAALLRQHFPSFPLPCFMIIMEFSGACTQTPQGLANLQVCVRNELAALTINPYLLHFSAKMAVLIYSEKRSLAEAEDMTAFLTLSRKIEDKMDCHTHICVGRSVRRPEELHSSFTRIRQQLRMADDSQLLLNEAEPRADIVAEAFSYPTNFYEALVRNQLQTALDQLNEHVRLFMKNSSATETELQQLFYSYRQVLCQTAAANNLSAEEIRIPHYDPNTCLSDLTESIRACAERICAAQRLVNATENTRREQEILSAIETGLSNPDFSIDTIVEAYKISNRSLQSLMRSATGTSFMDYVNLRRMERAKQLLLTTEAPIQEIVDQCGYRSPNTFYKAFQRAYGMPPNAMRKATAQTRGQ